MKFFETLEKRRLMSEASISGSYLGGTGDDSIQSIVIDDGGNQYVAGTTNSLDLPVRTNSLASAGFNDAFVSKVGANGTVLWSTYVGGSDDDFGYAIAVDSTGNAFLVGQTAF